MSKIDDIRRKLERAEQHLDHFKAAINGRVGPIFPPHSVDINYQPQWQHIALTADGLKPEQQIIYGILIGDVVHQTRSALDHLIYALATRNGKTVTEKEAKALKFPIAFKQQSFDSESIVSGGFLEQQIGVNEFTLVQKSQPYERQRDELWILKTLDDIDKHRTVLVMDNRVRVDATAYSADGSLTHKFKAVTHPGETNAELFDIGWPHQSPPAAVTVDDVSRFIVFTEPPICEGREAIPLMRRIIAETLDRLIAFDNAHFFGF